MTESRTRGRDLAAVWPSLLGVLVLVVAAVLVLSTARARTDDSRGAGPVAPALLPRMVAPGAAADTAAPFTAPDLVPMVGRRVRVPAAVVESVVGDGVFWIGRGLSPRLLVVRDVARSTPARVEPGRTVSVTGTLRRMPERLADWRARYGLTAAALPGLRDANVYLDADSVAAVRQ